MCHSLALPAVGVGEVGGCTCMAADPLLWGPWGRAWSLSRPLSEREGGRGSHLHVHFPLPRRVASVSTLIGSVVRTDLGADARTMAGRTVFVTRAAVSQ